MHLIVLRTAHHIARHLGKGRWRREETAHDRFAVLVTTDAVAVIEGGDDTRELDRHIGTILVAVHIRVGTLLPLIRAMQVQIEFLTGTERITTRQTDLGLGTVTTTGTSYGVTLYIEVIGLVEGAVQLQIEGVAVCAWNKLEVGTAEHTGGIDLTGRLLVFLVAECLTGAQTQIAQYHTGHDRRFLTIEMQGEIATLHRVGQLLAGRLSEAHIQLTDIPLAQRCLGHTVSQLETQLRLVLDCKGIRQIGGVTGGIEIIAVVTQ